MEMETSKDRLGVTSPTPTHSHLVIMLMLKLKSGGLLNLNTRKATLPTNTTFILNHPCQET